MAGVTEPVVDLGLGAPVPEQAGGVLDHRPFPRATRRSLAAVNVFVPSRFWLGTAPDCTTRVGAPGDKWLSAVPLSGVVPAVQTVDVADSTLGLDGGTTTREVGRATVPSARDEIPASCLTGSHL